MRHELGTAQNPVSEVRFTSTMNYYGYAMNAKKTVLFLITFTVLGVSGCGTRSQESVDKSGDAAQCRQQVLRLDGLVIDTSDCGYATGHWRVEVEPTLPGLALWRDAERIDTVVQLFTKTPTEEIAAILPALRSRGYIPDDDDCRFVPAEVRPMVRTIALFEIRPFGARLQRLQATPVDEVPDPPCGAMGWSTHGLRYFMTDLRRPDRVVYINEGQDGTQIDPRSIRWEQ